MIAQVLRPCQEVVARLAEVPRFGVDSRAAEVGVHLSLRRAVDLLGRDLSREGGKRRREPQQPFSERKQISAAGAETSSHAAATNRGAPPEAAQTRNIVNKKEGLAFKSLSPLVSHSLAD